MSVGLKKLQKTSANANAYTAPPAQLVRGIKGSVGLNIQLSATRMPSSSALLKSSASVRIPLQIANIIRTIGAPLWGPTNA